MIDNKKKFCPIFFESTILIVNFLFGSHSTNTYTNITHQIEMITPHYKIDSVILNHISFFKSTLNDK